MAYQPRTGPGPRGRAPRLVGTTEQAARIFLSLSIVTGAGLSTAACGSGEDSEDEEYSVACVDEDGNVVDPENCQTDGNGRLIHTGGTHTYFLQQYPTRLYGSSVRPGTHIDPGVGSRFSPTDANARANAGLSKTGSVPNGSRVSSVKSGGIGKGSSNSGIGGGGKGASGKGGGGFGG